MIVFFGCIFFLAVFTSGFILGARTGARGARERARYWETVVYRCRLLFGVCPTCSNPRRPEEVRDPQAYEKALRGRKRIGVS